MYTGIEVQVRQAQDMICMGSGSMSCKTQAMPDTPVIILI